MTAPSLSSSSLAEGGRPWRRVGRSWGGRARPGVRRGGSLEGMIRGKVCEDQDRPTRRDKINRIEYDTC